MMVSRFFGISAMTFAAALVAFMLALVFVAPVVAQTTSCPASDAALQTCLASAATLNSDPNYASKAPFTCSYSADYGGRPAWVQYNKSGAIQGGYAFTMCAGYDPNAARCQARSNLAMAFDGTHTKATNGGCEYALVSDSDAAVKVCTVWNGKQFCTGTATWKPTGIYTGTPAQNPDPTPPAPRICNGGSCYDPASNKYCAESGSGQVCVSGGSASAPPSACSSNGGTTLCAGAPPPVPPNPPIADPGSQIASSDKYSNQSGTGTVSLVTVNNFNNTGTGSNNGAASGDTGAPASSASSPTPEGDGTTSSGGGDCNTPPIVQGSGGMSAIAYQTWRTRCALEGQKGGTGSSVGTLYTKSSDTAQSVVAGFQASVQNAPIAGAVTGFFSVGNVSGACPTWTLAATEWNPQMTFDFYCRPEASDMLDMARIVLLIACAYVAFVIAMGDS